MNFLIFLPIISGSISGVIAIFYFLLFKRRPSQTIYLKFALAALLVMFYGLASAGFYNSATIETSLSWRRLQSVSLALFSIFYLDFIIDLTKYKKIYFLRLMQVIASVTVLLQLTITGPLTWSSNGIQKSTVLIFNSQILFFDAKPGLISIILYAIGLLTYAYVVIITIYQRNRISIRIRNIIISSVILFFIGFLNDTLISTGVLQSIYLISTSLLLLTLMTAYSMLDTILEDAQLKQKLVFANQNLETLTNQLEERVTNRTLELQDQAEFFQSLINNNPVAIVILDNQESIMQVNAMFTEVFGFTPKEVLGKQLDSLIVPEDEQETAKSLTNRVMKMEQVSTIAVRKRKDGSRVHVEISGVPVVVKGKKVGGLGIYQDITERLLAENKLIENEAKYRSLFYDSPIALKEEDYSAVKIMLDKLKNTGVSDFESHFAKNPDLVPKAIQLIQTVNLNHATVLLYGAKNEKALMGSLESAVPESSYKVFAKHLSNFMAGASQFTSEIDLQKTNGEIFHAISHVSIAPGYEDTWEKVFISILDNTERKINQRYLEYLSTHDQLTGLANRTLLFERLGHAIKHASRNKTSIAIFFVDLDGFKRINDDYGHHIGDKLLQLASKRLKNSLRDSDTIARVGGDEFILILENFKEEEILPAVADKILTIISRPYHIEDATCSITTSIGISQVPKHGTDPEELISIADTAMYESKKLGKNRFHIAP